MNHLVQIGLLITNEFPNISNSLGVLLINIGEGIYIGFVLISDQAVLEDGKIYETLVIICDLGWDTSHDDYNVDAVQERRIISVD
jgi:hypothetical protein